MSTPDTGEIKFSEVATETGLASPNLMSDFYDIANVAGGGGLMYHNLNMATGNATTAKVAIWDQYNSGTNQALTNWYNYFQDIGMVMTYLVTNNSAYGVTVSVVLWDSSNITQGTIFNGLVAATSNTGTNTVNTGLLSQNMTGGYRVAIDSVQFSPPPGPGQTFTVSLSVASASDTDGVGQSTTRTTYGLGGYTESGFPAPPPTPYTATKACDVSGSVIPCNKRTTISITIS
jgi:hypothetical protein